MFLSLGNILISKAIECAEHKNLSTHGKNRALKHILHVFVIPVLEKQRQVQPWASLAKQPKRIREP